MRKAFTVLVTCIIALLSCKPAQSLSCAQIEMNAEAVEKSQAIFEGVVIGAEVAAKPAAPDEFNQLSIFTFRVTKVWKGVQVGEDVKISSNTYWGTTFTEGDTYLVVAESLQEGVLNAGLCGHTRRIEQAEEKLNFLHQHFVSE